MTANTTHTVHGRLEHARMQLTPAQLAIGLLLIAVLGFTLVFSQEAMVHDSMHNVRHAAGIVCH
ncbi:MAG: CbtB domain-containing protein [Haloglomus sp.]